MQAFWVITLITILMVAVSASFLVSDIEENTTSEVTLVDVDGRCDAAAIDAIAAMPDVIKVTLL